MGLAESANKFNGGSPISADVKRRAQVIWQEKRATARRWPASGWSCTARLGAKWRGAIRARAQHEAREGREANTRLFAVQLFAPLLAYNRVVLIFWLARNKRLTRHQFELHLDSGDLSHVF